MVKAYLVAGAAVVRRDARTFLSYRFGFVSQLLGAFFSMTLFYYLSRLVRVRQFGTSDAYFAFVVIGLIILQVLNSTLQTPPSSVRQELVAGTLERIVISPLGPVAGLAAALVFPLVNALVTGVAMLAFASLLFHLSVQWSTAPLAVPIGLLGALAFAPFGLCLMALVLVVKQATVGTTWIVAGISLLAGLYFPVKLLPNWIQWASTVQPFTPAVELLRNVLVGTPLTRPFWLDLATMVGFTVVLLPLSTLAVRLALQVSRRRGTIIEY